MAVHSRPKLSSIRLRPRQKYVALTLIALQRALAYRSTVLLNLLAGLIQVAVMYYLWRTIYAAKGQLQGFTWNEMGTYILLAYVLNALLAFQSLQRIVNMVRTGDVAIELLRPVSYLGSQLAQTIGAALVEGALSSSIALLLGIFALHMRLPKTPLAACFFVLSICLGFLIKFLISYLVALFCFYTQNAVGLIWTQTAVINLFSGALIPLPFFPDWLKGIIAVLPFQGIIYTPIALYLGKIQGIEIGIALGIQFLWVILLWLLCRAFWRKSMGWLDIQGG